MKASIFQSIVTKIFKPELDARGYEIDLDPPGFDFKGNIWFEKRLQEGIFVLIHIQPSSIGLDNFHSFTINLARNAPGYRAYRGWQTLPGYFLGERLASAIWINDRHDPEWESDHWWYFQNEETLEEVCKYALEKLLKYGIPYLEDLSSKSIFRSGG